MQSLLERGSRLWIPEDKNSAKAIAGSIRETTTRIKSGKAGERKNCPTEVVGRPRKPFQGPEQRGMGRTRGECNLCCVRVEFADKGVSACASHVDRVQKIVG